MDNLYHYFRDLDRRALGEGLDPARCREVVARKRRTIESQQFKGNPLVASVLAGKTTCVAVYDSFSREFRGLRRFIPKSHDPEWNERLDQFAEIVPNVRHFRRRSYLAFDNPLGSLIYGIVAGFGIAVIWAIEQSVGGEPGDAVNLVAGPQGTLLMGFMGAAGFVFGSLAMLKYRTRDYNMIHAREAAGYMDLNFGFCRANDDAGWARLLEAKPGGAGSTLVRPD